MFKMDQKPAISILTKNELKEKIINRDVNLQFLVYSNKSSSWKTFKKILFHGVIQPFVKCTICDTIVTYRAQTGTGSLKRHTCNIQTQKLVIKEEPTCTVHDQGIPESVIQELHESQLKFIAHDVRPLDTVSENAFCAFAQTLINIGANYGKQDAKLILANKNVISESVLPQMYYSIKNELSLLLSENHISFTSDIWHDKFTASDFLSLTCHFIDHNFELKNYLLGIREFSVVNTGENLRNFVLNILREYLPDANQRKLREGVIVTDNSDESISAFTAYTRLSCACHSINAIVENVFADANGEAETNVDKEIMGLLANARDLVAYAKKTMLNKNLTSKLNQEIPRVSTTRYTMLNSILMNYDSLQFILGEEQHRLTGLNLSTLQSLVDFLKPFFDAFHSLSSDNKPTLNEVCLWKKKLLDHCEVEAGDSDVLINLKSKAQPLIKNTIVLHKLHYIALFLDPNFRKLKFLTAEEREDTQKNIKKMLIDIYESTEEQAPVLTPTLVLTENDQFKEYMDFECDSSLSVATIVKNEIDSYTNFKLREKCTNILQFWKESDEFILLKKVAGRVLNIPASSAFYEKTISISVKKFEERRTQIKSNHLDKLLFLHKNW